MYPIENNYICIYKNLHIKLLYKGSSRKIKPPPTPIVKITERFCKEEILYVTSQYVVVGVSRKYERIHKSERNRGPYTQFEPYRGIFVPGETYALSHPVSTCNFIIVTLRKGSLGTEEDRTSDTDRL